MSSLAKRLKSLQNVVKQKVENSLVNSLSQGFFLLFTVGFDRIIKNYNISAIRGNITEIKTIAKLFNSLSATKILQN